MAERKRIEALVAAVTNCGRICLGRKKINFGTVFASQAVGIRKKTREAASQVTRHPFFCG